MQRGRGEGWRRAAGYVYVYSLAVGEAAGARHVGNQRDLALQLVKGVRLAWGRGYASRSELRLSHRSLGPRSPLATHAARRSTRARSTRRSLLERAARPQAPAAGRVLTLKRLGGQAVDRGHWDDASRAGSARRGPGAGGKGQGPGGDALHGEGKQ